MEGVLIFWLEVNLSFLRKPYLARHFTTYHQVVEWVGLISGDHYVRSDQGIKKGRYKTK